MEDTGESPMKTSPDGPEDGVETQNGVEAQSLMVVSSAKKKPDLSTTSSVDDGAGMAVAITSERVPPPPHGYVAPRDRKKHRAGSSPLKKTDTQSELVGSLEERRRAQ